MEKKDNQGAWRGCLRPLAWVGLVLLAALSACSGKVPDWIDGQDPRYPSASYLLAVGVDPQRGQAESMARAKVLGPLAEAGEPGEALARDWHRRGGESSRDRYAQKMEAVRQQIFESVEKEVAIGDVWPGYDGELFHALALLERERGAKRLRKLLAEADAKLVAHWDQAGAAASPLEAAAGYIRTLEDLDRRQAVARALATLQPGSAVAPTALDDAEVRARANAAVAGIRFGVEIRGPRAENLRGMVIRQLTGLGMTLAPPWDRDLELRGTLQEFPGSGRGDVGVSCAVEVIAEGQRSLGTWRFSAGRESNSGEDTGGEALGALGEKLASLLVEKILQGG
ncbi:hypothetical protein [Desulfuromonas versatilis]|nr:hypothetical protein [Desulfuromonas versatilis]